MYSYVNSIYKCAYTGSNITGFGLIYALQGLIEDDSRIGSSSALSSVNIFFVAVAAIQCIILIFYQGQYKRTENDRSNSGDKISERGGGSSRNGGSRTSSRNGSSHFAPLLSSEWE
jgi:hypothetical protein